MIQTLRGPVLAIGLSILAMSGCAKRPAEPDVDRDLIEVAFSPKKYLKPEARLSEAEESLVARLEAKERVSHALITRLLIERQADQFAQKHSKEIATGATAKLSEVLNGIGSNKDRHQFKIDLEASLKKASLSLVYNRAADSLLDIVTTGRLQSLSATLLYQVARRQAMPGVDFETEQNVVLFSAGHVFSGYRRGEGVVGIEHTMLGRSEIFIQQGLIADGTIRVIDASRWAVIEIFKDRMDLSSGLDGMALAFGESKIPEGDLELQASGDLPRDVGNGGAERFLLPKSAHKAGDGCCGPEAPCCAPTNPGPAGEPIIGAEFEHIRHVRLASPSSPDPVYRIGLLDLIKARDAEAMFAGDLPRLREDVLSIAYWTEFRQLVRTARRQLVMVDLSERTPKYWVVQAVGSRVTFREAPKPIEGQLVDWVVSSEAPLENFKK